MGRDKTWHCRACKKLVIPAVVVAAALLVGCAERPEITPGAPPPTAAARVGSSEGVQGQDGSPDALDVRFPLPAPTIDAQVVDLDDSQCIDCHTDLERVQALAVEPEEEEKLSEGEG